MHVRFRLLGEVEALVGGRSVDIGHARQQCVLAALLVDANRLLAVDQLTDRVWAGRPPQRARNILSSYVSRLRQALAPASDEVTILRKPGGYMIAVDLLAVDLHEFQHLAATARDTVDEVAALALYERALDLWHGDALATLDTPWVDNLRVTLDSQRLGVELDRNDLALAQGRHAALLAELSARAAAFPLDERLTGQLMLALYRSGRQAEALQHYERLRRDLADQLGADPGPPLQLLYKQILTTDPDLTLPATPVEQSQPPVPRQLPAPPGSFTGREAQLALLDEVGAAAVDDAPPVIAAVSGTAGVGKTALALTWAHRAAVQFADGQLYANLRGYDHAAAPLTPAEVIRGFLEALGIPPARIPSSADAQAGLYRSTLAGRRVLIVLDDAHDADQVRPLLPGTGGSLVLVTSRHQFAGLATTHRVRVANLDLLTAEESAALLHQRLGATRLAAEPAAVDGIIRRCAGLPLALAIVAARAATRPDFPLGALAAALDRADGSLDEFAGGDPASDARTVFSWSYRALSVPAARLFRLLGLHPGADLGALAAASLAGLPPAQVQPLLTELTRVHLLMEPVPGRYTFHDLLRSYAAEQAAQHDSPDERHAAVYRLVDHYLQTALRAAMLVHPYRDAIPFPAPQPGVTIERLADYGQAVAWIVTEQDALFSAAERAAGTWDAHVWQLAWSMWTYLDRRGYWHDMETIGRAGLAAAERLGDRFGAAITHRLLGCAAMRLDRYGDSHAHLERALELYSAAGDRAGEANAHANLGVVCEGRQRYLEALSHAERALELYRAIGHRRGQAHGLNSVGWYRALSGDHRGGIADCRKALAALQALGDDTAGEAMTWDSIGYAQHQLGDHADAIASYREALRRYVDIGDRYSEATTLARLGGTHLSAGDRRAARSAWQRALAIFNELRHPDADQVREKLRVTTDVGR